MSRPLFIATRTAWVLAAAWVLTVASPAPAGADVPVAADVPAGQLRFSLSDRLADVDVRDGMVTLRTPDGPVTVTADTFVRALEAKQGGREQRGWVYQIFDITSPAGMIWVGVGLLGQVLFTGRMVVQWLASEKSKQSIVPPAFWWMSIFGATMLITYFTWRVDVVGILGQLTGWGIYARNLWMIYHPHPQPSAPPSAAPAGPSPLADPAPEPTDAPARA